MSCKRDPDYCEEYHSYSTGYAELPQEVIEEWDPNRRDEAVEAILTKEKNISHNPECVEALLRDGSWTHDDVWEVCDAGDNWWEITIKDIAVVRLDPSFCPFCRGELAKGELTQPRRDGDGYKCLRCGSAFEIIQE
jgi:hypothetical protein